MDRGKLSGWCSAEIEPSTVSIAVEIKSMMANDLTEGGHVDGEGEGEKYYVSKRFASHSFY